MRALFPVLNSNLLKLRHSKMCQNLLLLCYLDLLTNWIPFCIMYTDFCSRARMQDPWINSQTPYLIAPYLLTFPLVSQILISPYSLPLLILACPSNCDICTSGSACTVCSSGFENSGTTCTSIVSSGLPNCVTDNGSACTECASTYFLDPFSDLCVCE